MLFIGRYEKVIRLIKVIISWKNNDQIFWAGKIMTKFFGLTRFFLISNSVFGITLGLFSKFTFSRLKVI